MCHRKTTSQYHQLPQQTIAFASIKDIQNLNPVLIGLNEHSWKIGLFGGRKIVIQGKEYTMNDVLYKLFISYDLEGHKTFILKFHIGLTQAKKLDELGNEKLEKECALIKILTAIRQHFGNKNFSSRFFANKTRNQVFKILETLVDQKLKHANRAIVKRLKDNLNAAKDDQQKQPNFKTGYFFAGCDQLTKSELTSVTTLHPSINGREIGVAYTQGRRPSMEDAHLCQTITIQIGNQDLSCELFGVFDGHFGSEASAFVSKSLPSTLVKECTIQDIDNRTTEEVVWHALKETFKKIDQEFNKTCKHTRTGTTASVALVLNNRIWIANTGDSRTIFVDEKETRQLTVDQSPDRKKYAQTVVQKGGSIFNCGSYGFQVTKGYTHTLAMTRRIGGAFFPGVIPNPTITCYDLSKEQQGHLLLFCDGLVECDVKITRVPMTPSNEIGFAVQQMEKNKQPPQEIAKRLVGAALNKFGSEDNISCLVIPINTPQT